MLFLRIAKKYSHSKIRALAIHSNSYTNYNDRHLAKHRSTVYKKRLSSIFLYHAYYYITGGSTLPTTFTRIIIVSPPLLPLLHKLVLRTKQRRKVRHLHRFGMSSYIRKPVGLSGQENISG